MSFLAFLAPAPDQDFAVLNVREQDSGNLVVDQLAVSRADFTATVARIEQRYAPRWVMTRTAPWLPLLLEADIHLGKAHMLDLAQRILHRSPFVSMRLGDVDLEPRPARMPAPNQDALFAEPAEASADLAAMEERYLQQRRALPEDAGQRRRIELLLHAESIGAVIAAEMEHHGLAWDERAHRALLREQLGPRVPEGQREPRLAALADELAHTLNTPGLNPDSPQELLRALQRAGYGLSSVRAWELEAHKDPVIELVLHYKQLSRLASAHGDAWLDQWIRDSRFHPHYVLGTVASGRWAATGGGALQLPHAIRQVITAPEGKVFVVADGSQLEPRILGAISQDSALQQAGQGQDLYQGLIDSQVAKDRDEAKLGMLSAIYGGTSSGAGAVVSALERGFPRAMSYVARAAQAGERGEGVHSWLGRGCPPADESWLHAQRNTADATAQSAADMAARSRGRFTRNFVVQATAAEWALVWMAQTRHLVFSAGLHTRCRQVFFVHDELVFETEPELAEGLARAIRLGAHRAGQSLFGPQSPDFPVSIATVRSYAEAK
ncbi:bifunctional 3'-5' exonuclease/DNA polymerase [Glutamicibacter sp. MNS18]|uniref:bifunctional 3'-5' exonuclease/DNA polymerase n=1 Tax=Glutamicibacter sp. MNS18 TaxID=2989817 RepID=UPI002235E1F6|nr:bifunctional 3'-5' exonuclease/DNA polymerase [Glutamicibacter sp. MNS18]MCW4464005.1 bifunctional 3'-5' exonuclease/DNA polymerase [Glutamicibacter sp. MNS18]